MQWLGCHCWLVQQCATRRKTLLAKWRPTDGIGSCLEPSDDGCSVSQWSHFGTTGLVRLEAAGAGSGAEAEWEAVGGLDHLEGQDVEADNTLDWSDDLVDDRVQRDQLVLGDEHAVAWQELPVGRRVGRVDDRPPVDRQDLTDTATARRRRPGDPDR